MRRIVIISSALVILGIAAYFILKFSDKKQYSEQNVNGIQAVPFNAIAILRIQKPFETWDEFTKSKYGKNLLHFSDVLELSGKLKQIKSVISRNEIFADLIEENPMYLSLHKTGVNGFGLLVAINYDGTEKEELLNVLTKEYPHSAKAKRLYEGVEIMDFTSTVSGKSLSVAIDGELLLLSTSPILMDESILQLKHRVSLHKHKSFSKLFKTADVNLDANLFLNLTEIPHLFNLFGNPTFLSKNKISYIGNWLGLDLKITNDGLSMNGFSQVDDSLPNFINSFTGQNPSKFNTGSILSEKTAYFSYNGISDFSKWMEAQKKILQQKQSLFQYEQSFQNIEKQNGINIKEDVYSWIGSEICFYVLEGTQENPFENAGYVIKAKDIDLASNKLKEIQQKSNAGNVGQYKEYPVGKINISNFLTHILGGSVIEPLETHYAIIQEYVIFANNSKQLQIIIDDYISGKTLLKSKEFERFYDNFSDESSYFIYLNPKKALNFWTYFMESKLAEKLVKNEKTLNWIDAIGFQAVANENLFFINAYSNYKTVKEEDKKLSMIECKLDAAFSQTPWVVINHYTQEKELLLQDDQYNLYLISNEGKILWKKKLRGKIVGEVFIIDRYKNNKFQYLFGTGSELQLIDRNGENVTGFPVQLTDKQTKGIGLADYENNKDYRIFVPCGKKLICYDKEGNLVTGFSSPVLLNNIACPPVYYSNEGKEYILLTDEGGKIHALSRKGEERLNLKNVLPPARKYYEIILKSTMAESGVISTDSKGNLVFVKFNDTKSASKVSNFSSSPLLGSILFSDANYKDISLLDQEKLIVHNNQKGNVLTINDLSHNPSYPIKTFLGNDGSYLITSTDKNTQKVYVYQNDGSLLNGFPMAGYSPVLIDDLNKDGSVNLIFGNSSGSLFIYSEF